jgi:hypothetical protein
VLESDAAESPEWWEEVVSFLKLAVSAAGADRVRLAGWRAVAGGLSRIGGKPTARSGTEIAMAISGGRHDTKGRGLGDGHQEAPSPPARSPERPSPSPRLRDRADPWGPTVGDPAVQEQTFRRPTPGPVLSSDQVQNVVDTMAAPDRLLASQQPAPRKDPEPLTKQQEALFQQELDTIQRDRRTPDELKRIQERRAGERKASAES